LVGSAGTLAAQRIGGRLDRANVSRAACRVLFGDLREARDIVAKALQEGGWSFRRDFNHVVAAWNERRDEVARAMGSRHFHEVAGAFKAIESLQDCRAASPLARGFDEHLSAPN
jgi:hypothetical protein